MEYSGRSGFNNTSAFAFAGGNTGTGGTVRQTTTKFEYYFKSKDYFKPLLVQSRSGSNDRQNSKKSKCINENASAAFVAKGNDDNPLQIANTLLANVRNKNSLCKDEEDNEEEHTKPAFGRQQQRWQLHQTC